MNISVLYRPTAPAGASPWRLIDEHGQELTWANDFLDAQRIRQLSPRSVRAYAYDLLHFARWWLPRGSANLPDIDEATLVAYVRDQLSREPRPVPQTINHRLGVLRCCCRFHAGHPLPTAFRHSWLTRPPLGYGRAHRLMAMGLRLREPQRVILPLSADQVARFWSSFRTFRDLALVALMLLDGLRSQETLDLELQDLQLAEAQIRVTGKGNKQRLLPLPPEAIEVLQHYLRLERPFTCSSRLFVSLSQ